MSHIPPSALASPAAAVRLPSIADQVFEGLYDRIVNLALPPGTRLSETEVAKAFDVSRQPVRDAFWRLSKLGFLTIRPQRATTVAGISEAAVLQARFVRAAIEVETVRVAAGCLDPDDLAALTALIGAQEAAVAAADKPRFHALDDAFHREICVRSGLGFAWGIVRENKAHMDRVRFLSLAFGVDIALAEHQAILAALAARDSEGAAAAMRVHLDRITIDLPRLRASHAGYFDDGPGGPALMPGLTGLGLPGPPEPSGQKE